MPSAPAIQNHFDPDFKDLPKVLPVFPLTGAVLLPGGRLPLNIFEPRYLAMVRHALAQPTRLIGMVQPVEDNADRDFESKIVPEVRRIGCAGRIISFQETDDGRYLITLGGLIRFGISEELSLDPGGFRKVVPDYRRYAEDLVDWDFSLPGRQNFLSLFRSYVETRQLSVDWKSIQSAPDDHLIVSLGMLCPFSPAEKQSLLECVDLIQMTDMMVALFEVAIANRHQPDRSLH